MYEKIADCINLLGAFCGKRDVPALTPEALWDTFHIRRADVMVLFGGSILAGGDVLAEAMRQQAAASYIIVGGEGHTTEALRVLTHREYPEISTAGRPEAEVFAAYLRQRYGLAPDFLECCSTNCGNNITFLLRLLEERQIPSQSVILCQDATMQRRMEAGMRKYAPEKTVISYAAYQAHVKEENGRLSFSSPIHGMWDMEHYISLLMGEILRLTDNAQGYGPLGKGFIAHVDVPASVAEAYDYLKKHYGDFTRG